MTNTNANVIPITVGIPKYIYSDITEYKIENLYSEENDVIRKAITDLVNSNSPIPQVAFLFALDEIKSSRVYVSTNLYNKIKEKIKLDTRLRNEKYLVNVAIQLFLIVNKTNKYETKHNSGNI